MLVHSPQVSPKKTVNLPSLPRPQADDTFVAIDSAYPGSLTALDHPKSMPTSAKSPGQVPSLEVEHSSFTSALSEQSLDCVRHILAYSVPFAPDTSKLRELFPNQDMGCFARGVQCPLREFLALFTHIGARSIDMAGSSAAAVRFVRHITTDIDFKVVVDSASLGDVLAKFKQQFAALIGSKTGLESSTPQQVDALFDAFMINNRQIAQGIYKIHPRVRRNTLQLDVVVKTSNATQRADYDELGSSYVIADLLKSPVCKQAVPDEIIEWLKEHNILYFTEDLNGISRLVKKLNNGRFNLLQPQLIDTLLTKLPSEKEAFKQAFTFLLRDNLIVQRQVIAHWLRCNSEQKSTYEKICKDIAFQLKSISDLSDSDLRSIIDNYLQGNNNLLRHVENPGNQSNDAILNKAETAFWCSQQGCAKTLLIEKLDILVGFLMRPEQEPLRKAILQKLFPLLAISDLIAMGQSLLEQPESPVRERQIQLILPALRHYSTRTKKSAETIFAGALYYELSQDTSFPSHVADQLIQTLEAVCTVPNLQLETLAKRQLPEFLLRCDETNRKRIARRWLHLDHGNSVALEQVLASAHTTAEWQALEPLLQQVAPQHSSNFALQLRLTTMLLQQGTAATQLIIAAFVSTAKLAATDDQRQQLMALQPLLQSPELRQYTVLGLILNAINKEQPDVLFWKIATARCGLWVATEATVATIKNNDAVIIEKSSFILQHYNEPETLLTRAQAYFRSQKYTNACTDFISLTHSRPAAYLDLALCYFHLGESQLAMQNLKLLEEKHPQFPGLLTAIAQVLSEYDSEDDIVYVERFKLQALQLAAWDPMLIHFCDALTRFSIKYSDDADAGNQALDAWLKLLSVHPEYGVDVSFIELCKHDFKTLKKATVTLLRRLENDFNQDNFTTLLMLITRFKKIFTEQVQKDDLNTFGANLAAIAASQPIGLLQQTAKQQRSLDFKAWVSMSNSFAAQMPFADHYRAYACMKIAVTHPDIDVQIRAQILYQQQLTYIHNITDSLRTLLDPDTLPNHPELQIAVSHLLRNLFQLADWCKIPGTPAINYLTHAMDNLLKSIFFNDSDRPYMEWEDITIRSSGYDKIARIAFIAFATQPQHDSLHSALEYLANFPPQEIDGMEKSSLIFLADMHNAAGQLGPESRESMRKKFPDNYLPDTTRITLFKELVELVATSAPALVRILRYANSKGYLRFDDRAPPASASQRSKKTKQSYVNGRINYFLNIIKNERPRDSWEEIIKELTRTETPENKEETCALIHAMQSFKSA